MFEKLLKPFTTASTTGSTTRYTIVIVSTILTILGAFNVLTPEQIKAITEKVPEAISVLTALIGLATAAYGIFTKSNSDKAQAAAKLIGAELPKHEDVVIKTPGKEPDIVVTYEETKK